MPAPEDNVRLDRTADGGITAYEFVSAISERVALSRAQLDDIMTELNSSSAARLSPEQLAAFNFRLNEYFSQINFITTAQKEIFDTIKSILSKL